MISGRIGDTVAPQYEHMGRERITHVLSWLVVALAVARAIAPGFASRLSFHRAGEVADALGARELDPGAPSHANAAVSGIGALAGRGMFEVAKASAAVALTRRPKLLAAVTAAMIGASLIDRWRERREGAPVS